MNRLVAITWAFLMLSVPGGAQADQTQPQLVKSQLAAIQHCGSNAHLPSAREFVQIAMSHGAKGIVDACDPMDSKCSTIEVTNNDGTSDSFSFSYEGYKRPEDQIDFRWHWTSSEAQGISKEFVYGYFFGGGYGGIEALDSETELAVLCVPNS